MSATPAWHHEAMNIVPLRNVHFAWQGHIPFAAWIVAVMKPRVLVELGTFSGTSYAAFCQSVRDERLGTKCFAVDTWQGDAHSLCYGNEVHDDLAAFNREHFADFSTLLRLNFDEALAKFADKSVDLMHIDGFHTYDAVKHDFETWAPKLSDNAVVLFHDTAERKADFGVWKFWAQVRKGRKIAEFTHSHGLGVLFMGNTLPPQAEALVAAMGDRSPTGPQAAFEARAKVIGRPVPDEGKRRDPLSRLIRSISKRL